MEDSAWGCAAMIAPNDTLGVFVEHFLLARDVSEKYADTVRARVAAFEAWTGCPVVLRSLTPGMLSEWLVSLQGAGLAAWTVKGSRANILAVWNAAADKHLCDYANPRQIRNITPPQQVPEGWSAEEVSRLVAHCETLAAELPNGISRSAYYSAVSRVGYDSGARRGDVLRMTQEQIDTSGLWTWVQKKTGKVNAARLHPSTLAAIAETFGPCRSLVFEWPYGPNHWATEFGRIVTGAGLRGSFKWLRRSSGSLVEAQQPGAGHKHLGNGAAVFDRHYSVPRIADANRPMPPELVA